MQDFDFYIDMVRAFFGVILGILLGTVILFNGFWGGAIFYAEAVFSAVWFIHLLFEYKKHKNGALRDWKDIDEIHSIDGEYNYKCTMQGMSDKHKEDGE